MLNFDFVDFIQISCFYFENINLEEKMKMIILMKLFEIELNCKVFFLFLNIEEEKIMNKIDLVYNKF